MTLDTLTLADVLATLPARAQGDRLAVLHGTVRFETGRAGEATTLRFDGGTVTPGPDVTDPGVVVRGSVEALAAVVAGELNAGLEYLRGTLDITGDTDLALGLGALFGLDPRLLDPVEVAGAVGQVGGRHLRSVMRSGFREVVLGEIFGRLPDFVNPRRAAKVDLTVGFRLLGHPSGEVERYVVTIRGGAAQVTTGDGGGSAGRDATVTCEGHDFLRLATGHLSPVIGVLRGQLKVRGDQGKALQLTSVLDIPHA